MDANLKEAKDCECYNKGNEWADEYDKWVDEILKEDEV